MGKIAVEDLDRLAGDPRIARQLASANLQRILIDIAQAQSPAERLEEHLRFNAHFDAFMVDCLTLLGLLPRNE